MLTEKWKALEKAAEAFVVLFTTKLLRLVPVLRALLMGNESATKPLQTEISRNPKIDCW